MKREREREKEERERERRSNCILTTLDIIFVYPAAVGG